MLKLRHVVEEPHGACIAATVPVGEAELADETKVAKPTATVEELIGQIRSGKRWRVFVAVAAVVGYMCWLGVAGRIQLWRIGRELARATATHTSYRSAAAWGSILMDFGPFPFYIAALFGTALRQTRRERDAALQLAASDDLAAIPPLLAAYGEPNRRLHRPIGAALASLLNRMECSDAARFNDRNIRTLYNIIKYSDAAWHLRRHGEHAEALALGAIHAVSIVGDWSALPLLDTMANVEHPSAAQERTAVAAREAYRELKARLGRELVGAGLLRAAEQPDAALVRPAAAAETAPAVLVRAADEVAD
jgi:hypothetical protein